MTLSQKFNLRNLPCFSFSIFSMNYLCLPAIGFTTLTLPLAKRFQMVKFNLVFFERFFQLFSYPPCFGGRFSGVQSYEAF